MTFSDSIPEGWQVFKLGDLAEVSAGGTPSRSNPSFWHGDIPWVTTAEINHSVITDTEEAISRLGLESSAAKILPPGTLLLALYGQGKTRGKVAVLGIEAATNQACASIRVKDSVSETFVFHALDSKYSEIRALSNSGSQENLSGTIVRSIELLIPPLPEQRAIAEALSDIDCLIAALNTLIAKKRAIKLATMQQLLTGKTRLPGFQGEWQRKRLGALGTFAKGRGIRKDDVAADGLPCVRYGEIYTHHNDYIRHFYSFVSRTVADQSYRLRKGDILFAGSGETASEIGKCVAFLGREEAYAGSDIVVFTPFAQDSMFLGYFLNRFSARDQMTRMGQGDAVVHISAYNLANLELVLPLPDEQRAIAQVLSDIDVEIEALEARVAKTRDIKQGMMQQLLTGRIRLVTPVPEEVPA